MFTSTYTPDRHFLVLDTELEKWLHEEFPEFPGLFVYLHKHTQKWVIGFWTRKESGEFIDLYNLGYDLGNLGSREYPLSRLYTKLMDTQVSHSLKRDIERADSNDLQYLVDKEETRVEKRAQRKTQIVIPRSYHSIR